MPWPAGQNKKQWEKGCRKTGQKAADRQHVNQAHALAERKNPEKEKTRRRQRKRQQCNKVSSFSSQQLRC